MNATLIKSMSSKSMCSSVKRWRAICVLGYSGKQAQSGTGLAMMYLICYCRGSLGMMSSCLMVICLYAIIALGGCVTSCLSVGCFGITKKLCESDQMNEACSGQLLGWCDFVRGRGCEIKITLNNFREKS